MTPTLHSAAVQMRVSVMTPDSKCQNPILGALETWNERRAGNIYIVYVENCGDEAHDCDDTFPANEYQCSPYIQSLYILTAHQAKRQKSGRLSESC